MTLIKPPAGRWPKDPKRAAERRFFLNLAAEEKAAYLGSSGPAGRARLIDPSSDEGRAIAERLRAIK
jgi:hypothetical protein